MAARDGISENRIQCMPEAAQPAATQTDYISHDALFKELIRTFFQEFVELFLPQAAAYLDFTNEAVFLEQEILPDLVLGDKHIVDLLARVKIKGVHTAEFSYCSSC